MMSSSGHDGARNGNLVAFVVLAALVAGVVLLLVVTVDALNRPRAGRPAAGDVSGAR